MKRTSLCKVLGVIVGVSAMALPALAQAPSTTASQPGNIMQRTPDQVTDMLAAKLNLTDDQKQQIKPIIADRQEKLREVRDDTSSRPMKRMRKVKSIFADSDKKIEAILTDPQKQQYIQLEQQLRQQARDRIQNGGAMSGGTPQ